jgi:peptidoglycan/LPS O-acetylase OafA/YrhL
MARALPLGMIGVTVFFVLSGFLITLLLLRERAAAGDASRGRLLASFYARRTLRIFPVYYLVLALLWVAAVPDYREDIGWYLGYASNVLFFRDMHWVGPAPHLWTLAVEEQFYLLWPLLMLWTPRRWLPGVIALAIVAGPAARYAWLSSTGLSPVAVDFVHVLMPTCMDCFGLGAALAWWRVRAKPPSPGLRVAGWMAVAIAAGAAVAWGTSFAMDACVFHRLAVSVVALGLVAGASRGMRGPLGALLGNRAVRYVGKVSYGIYLFHLFVPELYAWAGLPVFANVSAQFAAHLVVLLALAALSWYAFERPFLALKRRFAVPRTPSATVPPAASRDPSPSGAVRPEPETVP